MNLFKFILIFVFIVNCALSQSNFVVNGGFEDTISCPSNMGQIQLASPWINPSLNTPDLFHNCSFDNFNVVHVPNNGYGIQAPYNGQSYAGAYFWVKNSPSPGQREYIQTLLISSMVANHKYYVEYFVSCADFFKYATSSLHAYFSINAPTLNDVTVIIATPQIQNALGNFITDKNNWTKISGSFIANGGEQYLTIGNFFTDAFTDTLNIGGGSQPGAYYYIDDVSVIDSTAIGIAEQEKNNAKLHVFPNPAKDEISIEFSELKKGNMVVTDLNGKIVMQEPFETKLLQLDVSNLEAGVYFIEAILNDGKRLRQKLLKE
jgi:hypothetical protein